jgi:hypothetical protein
LQHRATIKNVHARKCPKNQPFSLTRPP